MSSISEELNKLVLELSSATDDTKHRELFSTLIGFASKVEVDLQKKRVAQELTNACTRHADLWDDAFGALLELMNTSNIMVKGIILKNLSSTC
eukprot:gene15702-4731_t